MREQYPFFRDGDEQTQAVIGEEAVNADLDGDYQKPYAVLTQKRLYCKNEQGNFITDASALQSASKGLLWLQRGQIQVGSGRRSGPGGKGDIQPVYGGPGAYAGRQAAESGEGADTYGLQAGERVDRSQ